MGSFIKRIQSARPRLHLTREKTGHGDPKKTDKPHANQPKNDTPETLPNRPPQALKIRESHLDKPTANYNTILKEHNELQNKHDLLEANLKDLNKRYTKMETGYKKEIALLKQGKQVKRLLRKIAILQEVHTAQEEAARGKFERLELKVIALPAELNKGRCPVGVDIEEYLRKGRERLEEVE